ncbi:YtxH domain-containing protein [Pedobacter boryungensis]|uniref:YtxH domain-containing protein n=1 Tax=Pedobacter boryungensis TaxID=869962 RepID=A0ABX2D993_9SPHI|nr:YtxH domain-containing protein [Pedobacter boryungensis]NQX30631.1 YtxH domain-containing protein [Pedobacter boryungensis]
MGFIKGALFGVAVYAAVKHITKKDILTGRSLLDDFMDKAPEYVEKVKDYASQVSDEFVEPEMRV